MSDISPERAKTPVVNVRYEKGLDPKNSLFKVDGQALGQAMVNIGYSSSVLKPLVIEDHPAAYGIAKYDDVTRTIRLNRRALMNSVREVYDQVLRYMGENPSNTKVEESDLFHEIAKSKWFKKLFPAYWPYNMLKDHGELDFWAGNADRRSRYIAAARDGTLESGKPLEEQRTRSRTHMEKLIEYAMHRYSSWTMAHEYEHIHNVGRKIVVQIGLGLAPVVTGFAILDAMTKSLPPNATSDTIILGIAASLGLGLYGFVKGRSMEEDASYKAGYNNATRFMDCFKINHDVFAREILGKIETSAQAGS